MFSLCQFHSFGATTIQPFDSGYTSQGSSESKSSSNGFQSSRPSWAISSLSAPLWMRSVSTWTSSEGRKRNENGSSIGSKRYGSPSLAPPVGDHVHVSSIIRFHEDYSRFLSSEVVQVDGHVFSLVLTFCANNSSITHKNRIVKQKPSKVPHCCSPFWIPACVNNSSIPHIKEASTRPKTKKGNLYVSRTSSPNQEINPSCT